MRFIIKLNLVLKVKAIFIERPVIYALLLKFRIIGIWIKLIKRNFNIQAF